MVFGTGLYLIVSNGNGDSSGNKSKITDLPKVEAQGRVNVLLLGVDNLDKENSGSRSDTMMLLSLDTKNNKASMISIPRDSRVKIRGRNGYDKINAAHAYGGVDLAIKTVKDFLGVPIHHYVKVDYQALFKTVDDVGGVEVNVPFHMKYDDPYAKPPLHIDLEEGKQLLDGKKAMQFVRFRKTNKRGYQDYPNQDIGRIQAQQQFISALASKVLSPSSLFKIPKYLDTFQNYVDTDMSKREMLELAMSGSKINMKSIEKETVPGEPIMINGISYYKPDAEALEEVVSRLFYGNEKKKDSFKIAVLNGSGKAGVASKISNKLEENDMKPSIVENADDFDVEKTIIYYNDEAQAEKIRRLLGKGKLVKDSDKLSEEKVDIIVLIGKDI